MQAQILALPAQDGRPINTCYWHLDTPKGFVIINHGMGEYAARYDQLARTLNDYGYTVIAHDHRSHGPETPTDDIGHYADSSGWDRVLSDVQTIYSFIRERSQGRPVFMLGHSMGSFITQAFLIGYRPQLSGCILSASNYAPRPLLHAGRLVARFEAIRQGPRGTSPLINALTFGAYNRSFAPTRTDFDWLSRNADEVDTYIRDPLCGFSCTNQLWLDLFDGLLSINSVSALKKLDSGLPFYVLGGDRDPVGAAGKGLKRLCHKLKTAGIQDVELALYPGGRHEMFNETNSKEVQQQLIAWLDGRLQQGARGDDSAELESRAKPDPAEHPVRPAKDRR